MQCANCNCQQNNLPGKPVSLWLDTAPKTDFPPLSKPIKVDAAILGGGIAGLSTAWQLKQAGLSVAVIEMDRIVRGVTGNTTAKITSQHGLIYHELIKRFGEAKARAYGEANQAGLSRIASLVQRYEIDCDFTRASAFTFTESADEVSQIEDEVKAAQSLGLPASFTTTTELPFSIKAAVKFADQAYFHPRNYLLALASSIHGDGSYIFEQTRAFDVDEGEPCTVVTDRGNLHAKDVVVTTHFPFLDRGFYFARMEPKRSYVVAARLKGEPPGDMYISTTPSHSIRSHPNDDDRLLLIGGESHKTGEGGDTAERYRNLEAYARERFDVESVEYRWSTQDNMPVDRLPFIGKYTPMSKHLYVATGFQGWGMANGAAAGILLSDLITGRPNEWADLYDPNRLKSITQVKKLASMGSDTIKGLAKRVSKPSTESVAAIAKGEAKIVEVDNEKTAVYRDGEGTLHAVSAICTHQGCQLGWNNAEKTWDCPCHGSRFDYDGKVLHGPAVKDLAKKFVKND